MSRSVKKGPFVEARLLGRVQEMNKRSERKVVKTWSRASVVFPDSSGTRSPSQRAAARARLRHREHGRSSLGEFAPTRTFRGHEKKTDRSSSLR